MNPTTTISQRRIRERDAEHQRTLARYLAENPDDVDDSPTFSELERALQEAVKNGTDDDLVQAHAAVDKFLANDLERVITRIDRRLGQ